VCVDLDGDGSRDLAVADLFGPGVALLRGLGGGTFDAPLMVPAAMGPVSVAAADVTRDARVDLAVAAVMADKVTLLAAEGPMGALGFRRTLDYTAGGQPAFVTFADLDGDQRPDLIVDNGLTNDISVLLGTR